MKAYQVPTTKQRKPVKYWEAGLNTGDPAYPYIVIDTNNSIALLRYKYGATAIYKAVR